MPPLMPFRPFWQTTDKTTVKLYCGHVTTVLARLPEKSVHCTITSPPYWNLRDYGTGTWSGGNAVCDHKPIVAPRVERPQKGLTGGTTTVDVGTIVKGGTCPRCGATRTDMQLGAEPSPDCKTDGQAQCDRCFVCSLVGVFRGVKRVLRDDGVMWLNLGDSFGSGGQLQGIPWRVALALQADGWVLRSDMPWVKLSPMPESTMNRPCKALEYFFMFTKSMNYFFDMQAVKVKGVSTYTSESFIPKSAKDSKVTDRSAASTASRANRSSNPVTPHSGRNFRNVDLFYESLKGPHGMIVAEGEGPIALDVTSQGYEGAHFATFPPKLVTPLIKAATSEKGCCAKCGAPWKRVTENTRLTPSGLNSQHKQRAIGVEDGNLGANGPTVDVKTLGWEPTCECYGKFVKKMVTKKVLRRTDDGGDDKRDHSLPSNQNGQGQSTLDNKPREEVEVEVEVEVYESETALEDHPIVPCTVMDPFIGSGTVGEVALGLDLRVVGIDLSEKYLLNNAVTRISGVLGRYRQSHLIPKT